MAEKAEKPAWSFWTGKKLTWKRDVKVQIYLRANAPRDKEGRMVLPANSDRRDEMHTYESGDLQWQWGGKESGGDIVMVRRA